MARSLTWQLAAFERRPERQEDAIARLLPRVPERGDVIGEERLHDILQMLVERALTLFPGGTITGTAVPERDAETSARHRLVIRIGSCGEIGPTDFAERVFALQRHSARNLSPEELQAVLVAVEPYERAATNPAFRE